MSSATTTNMTYRNTPDMSLILGWVINKEPLGPRTKTHRKPSLENSLRAFERFLGNKVASRATKRAYEQDRVDRFLAKRKIAKKQ